MEDGRERWISLSKVHLQQYHEALQAHLTALQQFCHRHQMLYAQVSTDMNLATVLSEEFTRVGLLAFR